MKHTRKQQKCYCPTCRKSMRGGGCGCSGNASNSANTNSIFSGGYRPKSGKKKFSGGSAFLSELSKSAYYPLNSRMNDASDPSQQTASRFQNFPDYTQERKMSFSGGKRTRKSKSKKVKKTRTRKCKNVKCKSKSKSKSKKMKGGMPYSNFITGNMESGSVGHISSMVLGSNPITAPSHLQGIGPYVPQTSYQGYDNHNTYLV